MAMVRHGEVYHYHLDHLGTPQEITNSQGQLVWAGQFKAYGNLALKRVNEIENNLRFQGQYFDEESGLHYNRHRYYDPNCGQFITQDPIGLLGGINNYQYVPNPTGWVDPLGLTAAKEGSGAIQNSQVQSDLPSTFNNQFPEHPTGFPNIISDTKMAKGAGAYNYVVLENNELIIGRKRNEIGGGHIDLANGNPVLAAGEVKIIKGEIKYIDNSSGHYEPYGLNAQAAAENAFKNKGFNVTNKYIEKIWVDNEKLPGGGSWKPIDEIDK